MKTAILCALALACIGEAMALEPITEVPRWVLESIAKVETGSRLIGENPYQTSSWDYHDKRDGKSGEKGPFQMGRAVFNQVNRWKGQQFRFSILSMYPGIAADYAAAWLQHCYDLTGSWDAAIQIWNCGFAGRKINRKRAADYLARVKLAGGATP